MTTMIMAQHQLNRTAARHVYNFMLLSSVLYLPQLKLFFICSFRKIGGPEPDETSGFKGGFKQVSYRLGGVENITVEVNNKLVNKEIHNVFGVIKGFDDPGKTKLLFGVT